MSRPSVSWNGDVFPLRPPMETLPARRLAVKRLQLGRNDVQHRTRPGVRGCCLAVFLHAGERSAIAAAPVYGLLLMGTLLALSAGVLRSIGRGIRRQAY